jgi:hypothetical protein
VEEQTGEEYLNLPDFTENPEYNDEDRPYKLGMDESCEYGLDAENTDDTDPGYCCGCDFFKTDAPNYEIGVCICEKLKRKTRKRPQPNGQAKPGNNSKP